MLRAHLVDRVGVLLLPFHPPSQVGFGRRRLHRLLLLRARLFHTSRLMISSPMTLVSCMPGVVILPHLRQPEPQILHAPHKFRAIDDAALRGGHDLAGRHVDRLHAHFLEDLRDYPRLPALHALEVCQVLDRPLEPAERLRAGRQNGKRDDVQLQLILVEVPPQVEAAALVEPSQKVDVSMPKGPAGVEEKSVAALFLPTQ